MVGGFEQQVGEWRTSSREIAQLIFSSQFTMAGVNYYYGRGELYPE